MPAFFIAVVPTVRDHGFFSSRRRFGSQFVSFASLLLWQQVVRVKTVAEVARLLQAVELRLQIRDKLRAIGFMYCLQKSVHRDGSPTGIFQGRSYNPGETLRAI